MRHRLAAGMAGGRKSGAAGAGAAPAGIPFPQQGVYALYPDAQHMPTRVRAFIDFLREQVG
jgi:DNA-binding transcriptional LysR family regulator